MRTGPEERRRNGKEEVIPEVRERNVKSWEKEYGNKVGGTGRAVSAGMCNISSLNL